ISTSTTIPKTRPSFWCSRPSRCSCSCTSCSRRSWNGRRISCRRARTATSRRPISRRRTAMPAMFTEKSAARSGDATCTFHADAIAASQEFRKNYESKLNVVKAKDMPWEHSPDGLIKHLVNHRMNTRECCVEAYMQFLKPGERSGKHRHMWEELVFVVEGEGY